MTGSLSDLAVQVAGELGIPACDPMTDEQDARFREEFGRRCTGQAATSLEPLLTPELARELLRECVTIVRPGETLVVRVRDWAPDQVEHYQQYVDACCPFPVRVVLGDELGVLEASPA